MLYLNQLFFPVCWILFNICSNAPIFLIFPNCPIVVPRLPFERDFQYPYPNCNRRFKTPHYWCQFVGLWSKSCRDAMHGVSNIFIFQLIHHAWRLENIFIFQLIHHAWRLENGFIFSIEMPRMASLPNGHTITMCCIFNKLYCIGEGKTIAYRNSDFPKCNSGKIIFTSLLTNWL